MGGFMNYGIGNGTSSLPAQQLATASTRAWTGCRVLYHPSSEVSKLKFQKRHRQSQNIHCRVRSCLFTVATRQCRGLYSSCLSLPIYIVVNRLRCAHVYSQRM